VGCACSRAERCRTAYGAFALALIPSNVRTQLGAGTSVAQGLFIEMFLTSLLMLAILLLAAEKHKATFIAPIGIGLALFVAELLGVYYTGGSLNPARSFGPSVVLRTFSSYRECCEGCRCYWQDEHLTRPMGK
jgi:glycerol uptake facilitator-like aquaporin